MHRKTTFWKNRTTAIATTSRRERWQQAPLIDLQTLADGQAILLLAPHPDDETIGCGGLIYQAASAGIAIYIAVLTDGAASHPNSKTHPPPRLAAVRRQEVLSAMNVLGVHKSHVWFADRPDGRLDRGDAELAKALERLAKRVSAKTILCAWGGDHHPDHRASYHLGLDLSARTGAALWAYPVWGQLRDSEHAPEYPDEPAFRLPISASLPKKLTAIHCHKSQLGKLIVDDPAGFSLRQQDLETFLTDYEFYIGSLESSSA